MCIVPEGQSLFRAIKIFSRPANERRSQSGKGKIFLGLSFQGDDEIPHLSRVVKTVGTPVAIANPLLAKHFFVNAHPFFSPKEKGAGRGRVLANVLGDPKGFPSNGIFIVFPFSYVDAAKFPVPFAMADNLIVAEKVVEVIFY